MLGVILFTATGCAEDLSDAECPLGASNAKSAVGEFFDASLDKDLSRASAVVVAGIEDEDIMWNMGRARTFVAEAGGRGSIVIEENVADRLGAGYAVDVRGTGSDEERRYQVLRESSRFCVLPDPSPGDVQSQ